MLQLDVVNDDDVQNVVRTIIEKEGKIDILVNNAGAGTAGNDTSTTSQIL